MVSAGYEVTLGELTKAAAAYKAHSDDVKQALAHFRPAADVPGSAFGNLAESAKMASGYEEFSGQVTKSITKLYETLQNGSENLVRSAANYWMAEELVKLYLEYLQEARRGASQDNTSPVPGT